MITGKDDDRIQLARKSVANFDQLDYDKKHLIIINHHPTEKVLVDNLIKNKFEFYIEKTPEVTLGYMRNVALQLVSHKGYWTTWDDDDYRHSSYLANFAKHIQSNTVVAISSRLEYNTNNATSWVGTKSDGFVLFLAPFDNRITYTNTDSMEDMNILQDIKDLGYKIKVLKNDPKLYIRYIHKNNTSLYVKPDRKHLVRGPTYSERWTTQKEGKYIDSKLYLSVVM
jgi:hypothetical protein